MLEQGGYEAGLLEKTKHSNQVKKHINAVETYKSEVDNTEATAEVLSARRREGEQLGSCVG